MSLRKGQHLFNEIAKTHELDIEYSNLHKIIFYMTDNEFDSIMKKFQPKEKS